MYNITLNLTRGILLLTFCCFAIKGKTMGYSHTHTVSTPLVATSFSPNTWQYSCSNKGIDPDFVKGRLPVYGTARLQPGSFLGAWIVNLGHSSSAEAGGVIKILSNNINASTAGWLSVAVHLDTTTTLLRDSGAVMVFEISANQKYQAPFIGTLYVQPVIISGTYDTLNGAYSITFKTREMSIVSASYIWTVCCLVIYLLLLIMFIYTTWLAIRALRKYLKE